jgi:hypothetical protein
VLPRRLLLLPALGAVSTLLVVAHSATAQSASGTVTGRVIWGPCIRGIPLPMTPDAQGQVSPDNPAQPDGQLRPQPIPAPPTGLPAGAVLVAVQNSAVNARTDEAGRFMLSGVPAGQYLTVAAGPVANSVSATASLPNVFVNGGQSVDIGTLSLGGPTPLAVACRILPGVGAAAGADTTQPGTVQPGTVQPNMEPPTNP